MKSPGRETACAACMGQAPRIHNARFEIALSSVPQAWEISRNYCVGLQWEHLADKERLADTSVLQALPDWQRILTWSIQAMK